MTQKHEVDATTLFLERIIMTKTKMVSWEEACSMLGVSSRDDDALSSLIREGFLTPIYLGERTMFYRSEVEHVAEMFGLGLEGDKQEIMK
jgi:hypothetical protein